MWTLKCFLKNAWKMFYDLKWTNWINAGEPDGRFAMSTPHYWLKNLPQQPFKVVTSVDAGKWFDEMEWHDFLRDYLCWIMCFPAQPFFFWELKRPCGWKNILNIPKTVQLPSLNVQVLRHPGQLRTFTDKLRLPQAAISANGVPSS